MLVVTMVIPSIQTHKFAVHEPNFESAQMYHLGLEDAAGLAKGT